MRLRRVNATQVAALTRTDLAVRAQLAAHYDALFAPFAVGDDGIAEQEAGETLLAVRRRLNTAAERRGWRLAFVRTEGEGFGLSGARGVWGLSGANKNGDSCELPGVQGNLLFSAKGARERDQQGQSCCSKAHCVLRHIGSGADRVFHPVTDIGRLGHAARAARTRTG
jgi:hypothetical protein